MSRESLTTEVLAAQAQLEQTQEDIIALHKQLIEKQNALAQGITEHMAKRLELFEEEARARKIVLCTRCWEPIPQVEAAFILVRGTAKRSGGYENSCYGFEKFFQLHIAGLNCREALLQRHGQCGAYDSSARNREEFFAFNVEKRDDGFYAHEFGSWVAIEKEKCKLPKPSDEVINKLADGWSLPPSIDFDYSKHRLIIHKRVALTQPA